MTHRQRRALALIYGAPRPIPAKELAQRLYTTVSGVRRVISALGGLVAHDPEGDTYTVRPEQRHRVDAIFKAPR